MIVWKINVTSTNFVSDFGASLKNIVGGKLKTYEKLLNKTLHETMTEFNKEYPTAKDVKIKFTEFTNGAVMLMVYGNVIK